MNARLKEFRPLTTRELAAQVAQAERDVVLTERERNAAKVALPSLLVRNDPDAIVQGRAEIEATERALRFATDAVKALHEAHRLAQAQEQCGNNAKSLAELESHGKAIRAAAVAADTALATWGDRLRDLISAMNSRDALLGALNINPDHWLMRAKLTHTVELGVWVASDGRIDIERGLDTMHQVKESGAASLGRLAAEVTAVELRTFRAALKV